jgi:integrase
MSENKISFTKANIESLPLPPSGKRSTYYDNKVNGLQVRVTSSGVKTFCVFRRLKHGNPERVTLGRFPDMTPEQARTQAIQINSLIASGVNPNDNPRALKAEITLKELFDDFLKYRQNRRGAYLAEKTKRSYRYDYGQYLERWGKKQLSMISDIDVSALHKKIGELHPTSANRVIALVSSLFSYAQERKFFSGKNPALGIKKFPEVKRERFLGADELPAFFEAVAQETNETLRDYILMSLLTGARRSNVMAMRWDEINFALAQWRIPMTKNGEPQTVALSPEAINILESRKGCDAIWVFPSHGASGHIMEPRKAWKRILDKAGISDLRIHDLRRTLGSWQAKTGASLAIVGKSLNHKSPNTTAIYARLDLDPVRESVERATDAMFEAAGLKNKET